MTRIAAALGSLALAVAPVPHVGHPLRGPLPRALRGRVPTTLPTRKHVVALTFDAGANNAGLPLIFATLKRLRAPATFFVTGHFAAYYPDWTRRVAARYPICNHTMNHVDLTRLSAAGVRAEVLGARQTIHRVTDRNPQPLFRFPYGVSDAAALRIVNSIGYAAIGYTADTGGWLGTRNGQSEATVLARALAALRPGAILVMHVGSNPHDGTTLDAHALGTVIRSVRRRGYRLVTLPGEYARLYPSWTRAR